MGTLAIVVLVCFGIVSVATVFLCCKGKYLAATVLFVVAFVATDIILATKKVRDEGQPQVLSDDFLPEFVVEKTTETAEGISVELKSKWGDSLFILSPPFPMDPGTKLSPDEVRKLMATQPPASIRLIRSEY